MSARTPLTRWPRDRVRRRREEPIAAFGLRVRRGTTGASVVLVVAMALAALSMPTQAAGYSVLAHEANIDALWDPTITALLHARFPGATPEQISKARAYAYGGCVIQDLGYYPFGSHFFSNLLHYVRTGDFISALIVDAQDVDEYTFALGALGHYSADNEGHPLAVNPSVSLMYPKLRAQFGDTVTYEQSPKNHVLVEFSFDVVQVASGAYAPEAYHTFIGFQVAKPLLERAFRETYGIEMKEIFFNEDLAIGTYRHAIATTIPEMTKVAWGRKREEIRRMIPGAQRQMVVFKLRRQQYDKEYGADYEKIHGFARFLGFMYQLIPKIGPFRAFSFSVPTPEAERLFLASFVTTREHFKQSLDAVSAANLHLANTDFDTGKPTTLGEYALADDTYDELLARLAAHQFANVSEDLRSNLVAHYGDVHRLPVGTNAERERSSNIRLRLMLLFAVQPPWQ